MDDTANELLSLAGNIEFEEDELARRDGKEGVNGKDNNVEGWVDKRTLMTGDELIELNESVEPVRLLLTRRKIKATKEKADWNCFTFESINLVEMLSMIAGRLTSYWCAVHNFKLRDGLAFVVLVRW